MPEPGLSPLQSSLPSAAAHFGAHVLAHAVNDPAAGAGAAVGGRPTVPAAPATATVPEPPAPEPPAPAPPPAGRPLPSVPSLVTSLAAPPAEPEAAPVAHGSALERIIRGPSGIGTESLHFAPREVPAAVPSGPAPGAVPETAVPEAEPPAAGRPIPGLYHHPIATPDPVRVAEVSRRIKEWAVEECSLYPPEWEDQFDGFSVASYMVGCHPDAPTIDHLMIATRLMVAENVVDDCYCEDHGGSPVGLGGRLLMAHTALDPVHTAAEYAPGWTESLRSDAPRRAYDSAMQYFRQGATPSQADRFRHDMARLHLGYLAEAAWAETNYVPEVWEYLAMRQFNNFRPCPTITDTIGGYELPADLHAQPAMQRVIALAGNATTIANDLYSYTKELDSPGLHLNLPVVISEREGVSHREAYLKAVEIHNELMHEFEAAAAELAAACPDPRVLRFLKGVAVWVDGNHHWHMTNTYRYSLPDFW
ncbi:2-methylisoborneol synthase [Streptomyces bambusae]|uniref:family 2 encapsulin nanocompartment cargo protein terpene cyclase n=1 Tax=Streptomyces bambusae TaxID=1550616 RepID=UPI001CFEC018|nr:family 2 encapsulin nanocompartment cargo protein terpene cyclase [Streptomyces bambusae]MCB5164101.1 2-methylisoborneol synthase [Streptomyces bambusae]